MATHKVNCAMQKNPNAVTVTVAPFKRDVKDGAPTLIWEADGANTIFPTTDFFAWKTGGTGTLPVRSSDGKTLTLSYTQTVASLWTYMVTIENGGCKVIVDPEVDNDPPGGA